MVSPIETPDACGSAGAPAALIAPRDRAHNAASARNGGAFSSDYRSARGEQGTVIVQQFVGGYEALDARPGLARRRAQQCEWRVAHLVAAVGTEGLLRGEAVPKRTGVELPTRPGVKLLRVSAQALRRVVLRVDRNRHQVQAIIRRQLALQRCESLAGERARRFAGGEDEIHY